MKKIAFTLAEVMIVLAVIGILTAILLPVAHNATPNENILKFKKAHNTLYTVIRELVNSDKYYLNGDLTTKANGESVNGKHDGDNEYLCTTFADVINAKDVNCANIQTGSQWHGQASIGGIENSGWQREQVMNKFDVHCKNAQGAITEEIKTGDGIIYYDCNPVIPFGISFNDLITIQGTDNSLESVERLYYKFTIDEAGAPDDGFYRVYKTFCIDIDGLNKGEEPFGYGIRFDGKIQHGKRADEWLKKSIQEKD